MTEVGQSSTSVPVEIAWDESGAPDGQNTSGATAAAGNAAASDEFPAQDELEVALKHFGTGGIGASLRYTRPFTRQLTGDTALMFPADKEYFDEASGVLRTVIRRYAYLRVATFATFLLMVLVQLSIFVSFAAGERGADATSDSAAWLQSIPVIGGLLYEPPSWLAANFSSALLSITIVGAIAFVIRFAARTVAFYDLTRKAEQLSFKVFTRLDDINTRVTEVCSKVRDRVGKGGTWPKRARSWIIIALYNAKRSEYLDRYMTTVIWKVRTSIFETETVFFAVKVALATMATVTVAMVAPLWAALLFALVMAFQTVFLWHLFGMRPKAFWQQQFRSSAPPNDEGREHYSDKIAAVVENLVDEVLSKEFGQGGGKGGS